jgi:hypothetical protein
MKLMTDHKLISKQTWRKFSHHILMTLGTGALLVIITGINGDLRRSPDWTLALPPLPKTISPHSFQCDKALSNSKEAGLGKCMQSKHSASEKGRADSRT